MNTAQIITKKRDGGELTDGEVADMVRGYVDNSVPDYQMAAWAMAVFLRGMTVEETASLTRHMLDSGVTLKWPMGGPPNADKHSTGGIGDKVSLPLTAALACCGVRVPMISGRGLGTTGGTIDKLESIPGFRTALSIDETQQITDQVGCVICSASEKIVPADRKLYALRDVTGTVPSIPLITASIMSKKLAEGLEALVLDVKYGSGAFMKSEKDARSLAQSLVETGKRMGVATAALLTDMNQPLGRLVGNTLEVNESIACLQGNGPADLRELTIALGGEALALAGVVENTHEGKTQIGAAIESGAAMQKFEEMVIAQGGDLADDRVVAAAGEILSVATGFITEIDTEQLGWAVIEMGGGRRQLGDPIDHGVGFEMLVRLGDFVEAGQPIVRVYRHNTAADRLVASAITIGSEPPKTTCPLVIARVD